jgi:hypothetical protein
MIVGDKLLHKKRIAFIENTLTHKFILKPIYNSFCLYANRRSYRHQQKMQQYQTSST